MKKVSKANIVIYIVVVFLITIISSLYYLYEFKDENISLSKKIILQEATAHFENMVFFRSWNAMHGSVYVKQHGDLKPNPYLIDNVLLTDKNETLIKINPAWMTRQVSQITNQHSKYFYNITSNKPLNPNNIANSFEKEALDYFDANSNEKYYYKFNKENQVFDFMGALNIQKACISCHPKYSEGELRGGIHVGIPLQGYLEHLNEIEQKTLIISFILVLVGLVILVTVLWLIDSIYKKFEIEKKLSEENILLNEKVAKEIKKNRDKDRILNSQAKSAQMGEMLSMIAHQWRQPLNALSASAISLNLKHQFGKLSDNDIRDTSEFIQNTTQDMSEVINDFMNFFKPEESKAYFLIDDSLEEALKIIITQFKSRDIIFNKHIEDGLEVFGHKKELSSILINLLSNARDALEDNSSSSKEITLNAKKVHKNCHISICDNANGIDSSIIDRIFDPYFTTKEQGKGTGIGLYMVKEMIEKDFYGTVEVLNSKDGACFNIVLPLDGLETKREE